MNINAFKTIYISGAITGLDRQEVVQQFKQAEQACKNLGYINIVNPLKLAHKSYHPFPWRDAIEEWSDYMRTDIKALCDCHAIYFLPNWKDSEGANLEMKIAEDLGLEIFFQLSVKIGV